MKNQAFNPYLPSFEYVPDGEPRVFGDRVYIFGSHDAFNGDGFCVNDYVCWSAPTDDPGSWRYEGVIYPKDRDPMNADGKMKLFAPDVVQGPDGRYYLYYVLNGAGVIGVAVCDTPAGDYQFHGYVHTPEGVPYGSRVGDVNSFDPGVLVDEDGSVYLYEGFAPRPGWLYDLIAKSGRLLQGGYCIRLAADMLTMLSEPILIAPGPMLAEGTDFAEHAFFEASSMRKVRGKYYFVYSSVLSHELCYAVSDFPDRDFRFGGTLISIGDIGLNGNQEALNYTGNTHGGMVEIGGQWYIFYHRQTNKQSCARQGCAERITIAPDGSIAQAEMTSCGLNGGSLRGTGTYEARIACNLGFREPTFGYGQPHEPDTEHPMFTQSGTDREDTPDQHIANLRDGAWCGFKYFTFSGQQHITARLRGTGTGELLVSTERGAAPAAVIPVTPALGWTDFPAQLTLPEGTHPLYFRYQGTGAVDFLQFSIQ